MAKEQFVPTSPVSVALRPLNKGIILDQPPQMLPAGAFLELKNYITGQRGFKRRGVSVVDGGQDSLLYPPGTAFSVLWKTDGTSVGIVCDSKFLYTFENDAITPQYWTYSTGTVSTSSSTMTGDGTSWSGAELYEGDVVILDADGDGDGPETALVSAVTSDTEIALSAAPSGTFGAGTDYVIRRAFAEVDPYLIDVLSVMNTIVVADGRRFLYSFDGTDFEDYNASETFVPHCVGYFKDRLWCGFITESGTTYRSRIRWSGLGSSNFNSFDTASFINLPYTNGYVQRLIPMGSLLMAMFSDTIFQGRPTNRSDLPVVFDPIETGGNGLVGMQAVCSWMDGLFFVGQDDIYFLSNRGLERIGTAVVRETVESCEQLWRVYVTPDPANDRILFGFPKNGEEIEELWTYAYKTQAWSRDTMGDVQAVKSVSFVDPITYGDLDTSGVLSTDSYTGWADVYPTYGAIVDSSEARTQLYYVANGQVFRITPTGSRDGNGELIECEFQTGDFDFDAPDTEKVCTRLSLKTEDVLDGDVVFAVSASNDRGSTWKSLGSLTISDGTDEGRINFRMRGAAVRFRFTSSSEVVPYVVSELVLRVRASGMEIQGR